VQQFDLPPVRARPAVAVPVSAVALADVPVWVTPELRSSCVVSSCACGEWRGCELRSRPVAVPSHSCDPSIDGPCCYGVHRRSHTRAQDANGGMFQHSRPSVPIAAVDYAESSRVVAVAIDGSHTRAQDANDGFRSYAPRSRLRRLIMPSLDLTARRCLSRGTIATPRRLGPSGGLSLPARRSSPAWRTLDLSAPPARESWRLLRPAACPLPDVLRSAGAPPRPGRGVAPAPAVVLRTDVRHCCRCRAAAALQLPGPTLGFSGAAELLDTAARAAAGPFAGAAPGCSSCNGRASF